MQIWESLSVLCAQIAARGEGARESRCENLRRGSPIEPPVITNESPLRNLGLYRSETNFYTISNNNSIRMRSEQSFFGPIMFPDLIRPFFIVKNDLDGSSNLFSGK